MRVREGTWGRILPVTLFAGYVLLLLYLTVFKRMIYGTTSGMFLESYKIDTANYSSFSINLVPFKTIYAYIVHPPTLIAAFTNLLGNLLAFMPLGMLAPVCIKSLNSNSRILIVSFCSSLFIEVVQFLLRIGSTDVDDVLLNSLGGLIGFLIYRGLIGLLWKYIGGRETAK